MLKLHKRWRWPVITKKKRKKEIKILTDRDRLKMEIAKELGLWDQVEKEGWESLTNAACGRVGGIMKKRLKEQKSLQGQ